MKKCPYCAEEIQDDAVKCKHCMEFLDPSKRPPPLPGASAKPDEELAWFYKTGFIVLTFAMVPPLAIPLVWMRPRLHLAVRIAATIFVIVACWIMVKAYFAFMDYYTEVRELMIGF